MYTEENFPGTDNANGSGTCKEDDVVVLIDELSASASEIWREQYKITTVDWCLEGAPSGKA